MISHWRLLQNDLIAIMENLVALVRTTMTWSSIEATNVQETNGKHSYENKLDTSGSTS